MPLDTRLVALTQAIAADVKSLFQGKQDKLNSGESIKTINGESVLGGGNLNIAPYQNLDAGDASTSFRDEVEIDCGGASWQ